MTSPVRIALLDSGVPGGTRDAASAAFADEGGKIVIAPVAADRLGHGAALWRIIHRHAPAARLLNGQIFTDRLGTSPAIVAAALDWAVGEGADIVNMSFGLRRDDAALSSACARALRAGVTLLGASPARGEPVYPSAYEGVLRISGDARCGPNQVSRLANAQADFGACPRDFGEERDRQTVGGASFATAHVTGLLARRHAEHDENDEKPYDYLARIANWQGAEKRTQ